MDHLKELFEINGNFVIIKQDLFEAREIFMERVWFIIKKIKNGTINDFEEYENLSRIYVNHHILGCEYSQNLMIKL
jgi:hypothetical protein